MANFVCSVDVARPVDAVARHWDRIEALPGIMSSVVAVDRLDAVRSRWVVRIAGEERTFEARVTEVIDGARVAWNADGEARHAGVVTFHRIDDHRSRVTLQLDWEPVGLFDQVGARFRLVERAICGDLERFARHVELAALGTGEAHPSPADEPTTGRTAESPGDIPAGGWFAVLKRTFKQLKADNVPVVAGGVAFFCFLALVPALAAVVSIYGLIADPDDVARQLESVLEGLPDNAASLLSDQLEDITASSAGGLGIAAAISVLGSVWSASKGVQSLIAALNIAYDEEETRKGLRLRAFTLLLTVGLAVGVAAITFAMVLVGAVADEFGSAGALALTILRWPVLLGLLVLALAVLYRIGPNRDDAEWRWVTPGAGLAAVLLVLGTLAFSYYVNSFGSFSETYGSLGAIVVLLLWLDLSAYVVVLGAELDAELERQTARDTTTGADEPMGTREAYAADTVAA